MTTLAKPLTLGTRPPTDMDPVEWLERNVIIPHGQPTRFDRNTAPHLIEPIREILDNRNRVVCCLAAVGTSKTTLYELLLPYIIAEDSGPTMVALHSDEEAKTWAETRAQPMLSACEPVAALMPANRHKSRTMDIMFPHMPLLFGGAKKSFLQAKSMRWVIGDECWLWRPGRIAELERRTHDRWNSRVILVSQAGDEGSDWHEKWEGTDQRRLGFDCHKCGDWHEWSLSMMRYDDERDEEGNWHWGKVSRSVRYELPCGATLDNRPQIRRRLADAGRYRATNPESIPGHVGLWWPFFAAPRIDPAKVVVEWLKANQPGAGVSGLQTFLQQRMAQFWRPDLGEEKIEFVGSDYRYTDYEDGKSIEGEFLRFATIDCQQDHYWLVIRAWRQDGSSMLLLDSKVFGIPRLHEILTTYQVRPGLTFVDTGYEPAMNRAICGQYGWTSIIGSRHKFFVHHIRGKSIKKPWSPMQRVSVGGKHVVHYAISVDTIKDVLAHLRAGRLALWEIPADVSEQWRKQMQSEVKVKDGEEHRWKRVKQHNHLWDAECYQVFVAMLFSILNPLGEVADAPTVDV
jgi:hypothetical protein